jgi:hypothetical protein
MSTLPSLADGVDDSWPVRVELRVVASTPKAFKVAAHFSGPLSHAGPSAWLPRSCCQTIGSGYDGSGHFTLTARVYRRLRDEVARASAAPAA